jgi:hypothetical protein
MKIRRQNKNNHALLSGTLYEVRGKAAYKKFPKIIPNKNNHRGMRFIHK